MMPAERLDHVCLAQLLDGLVDEAGAVPDMPVAGLALDSRHVVAGGVFVALPGGTAHGLDYLDHARERGVAAVLCEAGDPVPESEPVRRLQAAGIPLVRVARLAEHVSLIAARLLGQPSQRFDSVTAVTGTDGKTSVTHHIAGMLADKGDSAAVLGTLGYGAPGESLDAGLTTPDAVRLQYILAELGDAGHRHVALEASSHGLAQHRLDAVRIDVAVLTQLGRDHLDYHADAADYARAKARLFAWPGLRAAVLNFDDAFGRRLHAMHADALPIIGYSRHDRAGDDVLRATAVVPETDGMSVDIAWQGRQARVRLPLLGLFNVDNALAAAAALLALGHDFAEVSNRMARIRPVAGRMELFRQPGRAGVVVDYAHTAGALEAALAALRVHARGRIWCIFGAGGDRDRGKRPLMGQAAAAGADHLIITDDNPRSEAPAAIAADIRRGLPRGVEAVIEHDRGRALQQALDRADADDLILLAGKGHERVQVRLDEALPWSDRDAVRAALAERGEAGR